MPIFKIKMLGFENFGWARAHPVHPLDPRLVYPSNTIIVLVVL